MDPNTSSVQDAQNQKKSDQSMNLVQSPPTSTQQAQPAPQQQKTQTTISVNKEAGPATITVAKSADENAEEVVDVEVQPSIPEAKIEASVENVVEKSADQEKPEIPKEVQKVVTHSGPGVIDVTENTFGVAKMPVTYQQAKVEEKKTGIKESKHWFMAMIMYIWRKLKSKRKEE